MIWIIKLNYNSIVGEICLNCEFLDLDDERKALFSEIYERADLTKKELVVIKKEHHVLAKI